MLWGLLIRNSSIKEKGLVNLPFGRFNNERFWDSDKLSIYLL